ncbi:MAG: hypothetical protein RJA98_3100 [Pseudomonadota bacterium]
MATDRKDTTGFFRKVVKFVANPATQWSDLQQGETPQARETEFAKSELKAMIERKRRNDFVRKREFDMLRKIRREGLTGDQLAALGMSSRLDDSEPRAPEHSGLRDDVGVKAKIDAIEQQMVGESRFPSHVRSAPKMPGASAPQPQADFYNAPTVPAELPAHAAPRRATPDSKRGAALEFEPQALPPMPPAMARPGAPPQTSTPPAHTAAPAPAAPPSHFASFSLDSSPGSFDPSFTVEVNEVAHDPDLDEAVIAFANADYEHCEQSLVELTSPGASRAQHAETWLVVFDLYRAIGQQAKFETLAVDYAHAFGWSAPQWFSLPKLVADMAANERPSRSKSDGHVGWVCPPRLTLDDVAKLRTDTLQLPLPWVLDWSRLQQVEADAAGRLSDLFRHWIPQRLEMRWQDGERLLKVIEAQAPTGVRDVDPALWLLRLDALRMINRPDQFDETAIDYCVTYEVSPPSWERATCTARISQANRATESVQSSHFSEVTTSFMESEFADIGAMVEVASMELSGQLVGDIQSTLNRLSTQLGAAPVVSISCARLIRVDFIAAGDLLNWVLSRRAENRQILFTDAHRLIALFFGAMGINEHARIKVRAN